MTGEQGSRRRRLPYLIRLIGARPRLFIAVAVGVTVALVIPADRRLATRLLVAWDVSVALYLALVSEMVARSHIGEIRQRAAIQDEGKIGILVLTVVAALASFGAIIAELGSSAVQGQERQPRQLVLATLTILLSWAFTTRSSLCTTPTSSTARTPNKAGSRFPAARSPTTGTSCISRL
jgi:uncharacterized membrane protein